MRSQFAQQSDEISSVTDATAHPEPATPPRVLRRPSAPRDARVEARDPSMWGELLSGRWTVVEHDEGVDEGSFVLARGAAATRARSLTARERQVAALTAEGHSMKFVALDLEIGESTAATLLRRAMAKMGVRSRMELVRLCSVASRARCA